MDVREQIVRKTLRKRARPDREWLRDSDAEYVIVFSIRDAEPITRFVTLRHLRDGRAPCEQPDRRVEGQDRTGDT